MILSATGSDGRFVGIVPEAIVGKSFEALLLELDRLYGVVMHDPPVQSAANVIERDVVYSDGERETSMITATVLEPDGDASRSITFAVVQQSV